MQVPRVSPKLTVLLRPKAASKAAMLGIVSIAALLASGAALLSARAQSPPQEPAQAAGQPPDQDTLQAQPTPQVAAQPASGPEAQSPPQPASKTDTAANSGPASPGAASNDPAQRALLNTPGDSYAQQIDGQCADLFKLATALKLSVDKTTPDMLSVTVVRQAGQIEQLAHKVKGEMKPPAGGKG